MLVWPGGWVRPYRVCQPSQNLTTTTTDEATTGKTLQLIQRSRLRAKVCMIVSSTFILPVCKHGTPEHNVLCEYLSTVNTCQMSSVIYTRCVV